MPNSAASESSKRTRTAVVVAIVAAVVVAAIAGAVWWAVSSSNASKKLSADETKSAWSSAMKKAGVEATMPVEPTPITSYTGFGSHPFDAVFTGEEATALLNTYTLEAEIDGQKASISNAVVTFPEPGVMRLTGTVTSGDQSVDAAIEGKVTYTLADRIRAPEGADVTIEGFALSGANQQRATATALSVGNQYLIDAPKLIAVEAEIVDGGVRVKGQAPDRLIMLEKPKKP